MTGLNEFQGKNHGGSQFNVLSKNTEDMADFQGDNLDTFHFRRSSKSNNKASDLLVNDDKNERRNLTKDQVINRKSGAGDKRNIKFKRLNSTKPRFQKQSGRLGLKLGGSKVGPSGGVGKGLNKSSGGSYILNPKDHYVVILKENKNPNIDSSNADHSGNKLGFKNLIDSQSLSLKLKKILTKDMLDVGDQFSMQEQEGQLVLEYRYAICYTGNCS